jgi:hypothetical protein
MSHPTWEGRRLVWTAQGLQPEHRAAGHAKRRYEVLHRVQLSRRWRCRFWLTAGCPCGRPEEEGVQQRRTSPTVHGAQYVPSGTFNTCTALCCLLFGVCKHSLWIPGPALSTHSRSHNRPICTQWYPSWEQGARQGRYEMPTVRVVPFHATSAPRVSEMTRRGTKVRPATMAGATSSVSALPFAVAFLEPMVSSISRGR